MSFTFREGGADENRKRFWSKLGGNQLQRVGLMASHGDRVQKINRSGGSVELSYQQYDAAYTLTPELYLFGTFADCLPVFFFEPRARAAALAHAGWRGILAGVVPNTVRALALEGVDLEEVLVSVGPHIQSGCFEVDRDVADLFCASKTLSLQVIESKPKPTVDLKGVVFDQLVAGGLKPDNIHLSDECTHCDRAFFSNRRDRRKGAMLAFIGLRNSHPITP